MLKFARHIAIAIILSAIAWCIGEAVAEWYTDQLRSTGGMVTASEIMGAKFIPLMIAVIVFFAYFKIADT